MSVVTEQPMTQGEREAAKQDCVAKVARLGVLIAFLEPEAMGDQAVAQELADLRSSRDAARGELRKLLEAEREEKQASEAEARGAAEYREERLTRARELASERQAAAKAVDQGLRQFAIALAGYERICREQQSTLAAAGSKQAADTACSRGYTLGGALAYALQQSKVPARVLDMPSVSPSVVLPLSESDAIPIAPAAS